MSHCRKSNVHGRWDVRKAARIVPILGHLAAMVSQGILQAMTKFFHLCDPGIGEHCAILEVDERVELNGGATRHLGVAVTGVEVVGQAADGVAVL